MPIVEIDEQNLFTFIHVHDIAALLVYWYN